MATAQEIVAAQKKFTKITERMANPKDPRPLDPKHVNMVLQNLYEGRIWDELSAYRQIQGLIVIGPPEIEKAFLGPKGENVIDTPKPRGWCPKIEVPWFPSQLKKLVELCKTPEWDTTPVLWLCLPEHFTPMSPIRQFYWWGFPQGTHPGGLFRKNIMRDDQGFIHGDESWVSESPCKEPVWKIGYGLPKWSINRSWEDQEERARSFGLTIANAASDILMMNLAQIATGKNLRMPDLRARTVTRMEDRDDVFVNIGSQPIYAFAGTSYFVRINADSGHTHTKTGLAVEGLPIETSNI